MLKRICIFAKLSQWPSVHISESVFVLCGGFAVSSTEGTISFLSCMAMLCSQFMGSLLICPRVECISSFSLSRPCKTSHRISESRLRTFVILNWPLEPGCSLSTMNNNGGCQTAAKQEYVAPLSEQVLIISEQGILGFSNELTGEEELF